MKRSFNIILMFCALAFAFASCDSTKKVASTAGSTAANTQSRNDTPPPIPPPMLKSPGVITFAAANDRYSALGTFKKWKFTKIDMKNDKIENLNASLEIDLSSISEKSAKLTEHLKAWDYFDVAKYTTATMNISNVRAKGDGYVANLELMMRGAKQQMESEFRVVGTDPVRVKGTAKVDRGIFKIAVENTGVPNMIEVEYEAALVK